MAGQIHHFRTLCWASLSAAALLLSGCSTVGSAWESTKSAVGGLFGGDEEAETAADTTGQGPPSLSSVPSSAPVPPSTAAQRGGTAAALVADRERAQYTEQGGRREPVNVRPLDETMSQPTMDARLAMAPPQQSEALPAFPTAPAAPPVVANTPVPVPEPMASPQVPAGQGAQMATLVPAPTQVMNAPAVDTYGFETVVIGGAGPVSGPAGGSGGLGGFQPLASYPGTPAVSSQVAQVPDAALSAGDRRTLADAARLRAEVNGTIRVVAGAGGEAAARAVAEELRRQGVPANRLYVGTGPYGGAAADVFLDY